MDEELGPRFIFFSPWTLLFLLLLIIIGNLFILDVTFFSIKNSKISLKPLAVTAPTPVPQKTDSSEECNASCKEEIAKQIAAAYAEKTPIVQKQTSNSSSVKEYFVTLGSGSSTSSDWADIPGAQSYIDSNAYGKIKKVTFEVSLYTPTGNQTAYARLYNVTDKHPVWNSDVSIDGGLPELKISSSISLDLGSKLYQVQMRTQVQSRTNLENAKVHIVTY
jgi:hypothetical protein